jgi:DNA topoisomerase-1
MVIGTGRFGPYIRHNSAFYSLPKTEDPLSITKERAIEIVDAKRLADSQKVIRKFETDPEIQVLNGRYGPYITKGKENFKIPKGMDPQALTLADCEAIIKDEANKPKAVKKRKK